MSGAEPVTSSAVWQSKTALPVQSASRSMFNYDVGMTADRKRLPWRCICGAISSALVQGKTWVGLIADGVAFLELLSALHHSSCLGRVKRWGIRSPSSYNFSRGFGNCTCAPPAHRAATSDISNAFSTCCLVLNDLRMPLELLYLGKTGTGRYSLSNGPTKVDRVEWGSLLHSVTYVVHGRG